MFFFDTIITNNNLQILKPHRQCEISRPKGADVSDESEILIHATNSSIGTVKQCELCERLRARDTETKCRALRGWVDWHSLNGCLAGGVIFPFFSQT